jgi:hypothetical protein
MTHDQYRFKIYRDDGQLRPETLSSLLMNHGDAKVEISTRGEVIATIKEPLHEASEITMTATCTLYGVVHSVGRPQKPKVTLKLSDDQTVDCHTDKSLAVQLAHRLYQEVGVRGEAVRDLHGKIKSFEITCILPYKTKTREEFDLAFLKLSERYGVPFASCDDSFLRNLRSVE